MKGILFLILLVSSSTYSHASCLIQDLAGHCTEQAPATQEQVTPETANPGWDEAGGVTYASPKNNPVQSVLSINDHTKFIFKGLIVILIIVIMVYCLIKLNRYYEQKHRYSIFDWGNIVIITGFVVGGLFLSWYPCLYLSGGHYFIDTWILFIVTGVGIGWFRIIRRVGFKSSMVPLLVQIFLSCIGAFIIFLLSILFSSKTEKR